MNLHKSFSTRAFYTFLILLLLPSLIYAQKPSWVSSYGVNTSFHSTEYLTGFGMTTLTDLITLDQALSQAEASAKQDLIKKIRVQVESVTSSYLEERGDEFTSQFISATRTTASLELFGIRANTYVDERDKMTYALTYISIEAVRDQFRDMLSEKSVEFYRLKEAADQNVEAENLEVALDRYLRAKSLYSELIETWALIRSVERNMTFDQTGDWNPNQIHADIAEVDRQIERILNRPIRSLDDAAWWLANTMGEAAEESYGVNVNAITYRDSGISSEFANYLRQILIRQLNNRTNWVIQEIGVTYNRNPTHIVTGTFWDRDDEVHILLNVRETDSGRILAASEASVPQKVVDQSGLSLLPDNYEEAIADLQALQNNEGDNRGLNLSVWTNRGENNLVFEEGDIMEISLQVNLPSYIRILYHLKNGQRVLLLDSHYINPRDVNRPYTLPYRFQAVPPFGVESMQVIAQSEPFKRVQTREVDGLPILAEDLETFLSNTRGFVMVREEAQQTEQMLIITTMPRTTR